MSSDCVISAYLDSDYREGFGGRGPFAGYSGEGGADGAAKALAVDVKEVDCPDEDNRYSAMLFGKLVGESAISVEDRRMLSMFMKVAYEEHVTTFLLHLLHLRVEVARLVLLSKLAQLAENDEKEALAASGAGI